MRLVILPLIVFLISVSVCGQKLEYPISSIPDSLKQNANAVVRLNQLDVTIASQKLMTYKSIQIISVLNELGLRNLDLSENYDKNRKITSIEATVYDASGNFLKTFKRKDF